MAFKDRIRFSRAWSVTINGCRGGRTVGRYFRKLFLRTTGRNYPGPTRGPQTRRAWSRMLADIGLSARERHEITTKTPEESKLSALWHQPGFLWNALLERLGKPDFARKRPGRPKGGHRLAIEFDLLQRDDPKDVATRHNVTRNYVLRIWRDVRRAVHK